MNANQSVPGLNRALPLNFWWQRSANHVKFAEEYVMCIEKHFSPKVFIKGLNMALLL